MEGVRTFAAERDVGNVDENAECDAGKKRKASRQPHDNERVNDARAQ